MRATALQDGDTIGIVAPSWCGPAQAPHRMDRGIAYLESLGYRVVVAPHVYGDRGHLSGTPEERAADIHSLFADTSVRMIISAIGGDHSCHLLPLIDWDLIRRNPKIFIGYSDVTVLNLAIYTMTGLITFNGPALMTDLAEYPVPLSYTVDAMWRTLCHASPVGGVEQATVWTEEFLDWQTKADLRRARQLHRSPGWTWLKGTRGEGRLIGGCLGSLQHLRGTPYWPDCSGAILFIETSEEVPAPATVDGILQDYENMGVLSGLQGLLIGRAIGYTDGQRALLREIVLERTARHTFPVVMDMDFGHTAPQFTLPIGCRAAIETDARRFSITEAAVAARDETAG